MPINPSDYRYSVIKETVAGSMPATPALQIVPHISGDEPRLTADSISSNVVLPNRDKSGSKKVNYRVEGALKTHFKRSGENDMLMEGAHCGTFTSGILKGGTTDHSFSIEKQMPKSGTTYYHDFLGLQVTKMNLTVDAQSNAEVTYDFIGMDRTERAVAKAGVTYVPSSSALELTGLNVNNVTIAGLTAVCRALEYTCEVQKEAQDRFGSASAYGIGNAGPRDVMVKMTLYREDLSADTLLAKSDTPIAVEFSIGTGVDGYKCSIPQANYDIPTDEVDGSKSLITITFTAKRSETDATGVIWTKLS